MASKCACFLYCVLMALRLFIGSGARGKVKPEGRVSSIGMISILGWQAAEARDAEVWGLGRTGTRGLQGIHRKAVKTCLGESLYSHAHDSNYGRKHMFRKAWPTPWPGESRTSFIIIL